MKPIRTTWLALAAAACTALAFGATAQDPQTGSDPVLSTVGEAAGMDLRQAIEELEAQRGIEVEEKLELAERLGGLESELSEVRKEYQSTVRTLDRRSLDLTNLREEIEKRRKEADWVSDLLGDYMRNLESRLHIAEKQRYDERLDAARLALENSTLTEQQVYETQLSVVDMGLERIAEVLGGVRFEGRAVDPGSLVDEGTFVLVGPSAIFRSSDGSDVGTVVQRVDSLEPAIVAFADPKDIAAADSMSTAKSGEFPFDPTLGNAHKVEAATKETLLEHVKKGGPVMIPIFVMAGAALLVALLKWLGMLFVRTPSKKKFRALLEAVGTNDAEEAQARARRIGGPVGRMLQAGADHLGEPRELIEEVMYEQMLTSKLKLNRFLPFVSICAASAPLLGLLGTVTGIINTFKLITVFGSGDVKSLSGGISEALITTKFGLIVAIPSLLLHAFLSRKARSIVGSMETSAVAFVNAVAKSTIGRRPAAVGAQVPMAAPVVVNEGVADPDQVRTQVSEILSELLENVAREGDVPSSPSSTSNSERPPQPV